MRRSTLSPCVERRGGDNPIARGVNVSSTFGKYLCASATFDGVEDHGRTYDYAKDGRITVLHRDNRTRRLTHTGAKAWSVPDRKLVEVIHATH